MRRPAMTEEEVDELFGPLLPADKDDTSMPDVKASIDALSSADVADLASRLQHFADDVLQQIPPAQPVRSVLPPVYESSSESDRATLDWCRNRLAELKSDRAHIFAQIKKLLPNMNASVVECRYLNFIFRFTNWFI